MYIVQKKYYCYSSNKKVRSYRGGYKDLKKMVNVRRCVNLVFLCSTQTAFLDNHLTRYAISIRTQRTRTHLLRT